LGIKNVHIISIIADGKGIMRMNRRTARKKAIQSLFQIDVSETEPDEAIENILEENDEENDFLVTLVHGTVDHMNEIDEQIEKNVKHWTIERIGKVDRNVLRLAIFEMAYLEEIPEKVAMNEAIDLAKIFGGEQSGRFVNGVLSNISGKRD
jgi:N utilization substance protein B